MNREQVMEWSEKLAICYSASHKEFLHEGLLELAALVAAAERRKHQADIEAWKAEAVTAEKWRGMALAKDPMQPGKAVQVIQQEAAAAEREACAELCAKAADDCMSEGNGNGEYVAMYLRDYIVARGQNKETK